MNLLQKAEIHFYEPETVSFYLQSNSSDQLEKLGEIALGALYGVRTMSNLGRGALSERIALALETFPATSRQFADRAVMGNLKVTDYPGYDSRNPSVLDLRIGDGGIRFQVEPGVGYNAPGSVLALECYLARRRWSDAEFLRAFSASLAGCAALYRSGRITLRNQTQLVMPILKRSCPDYCGGLG
ncbi:MAG: hypothetical protein ACYC6Y_26515 [Thermoguttaceae bacterium]